MSGKETVQDKVSGAFCGWLRTEALTPNADYTTVVGDYSAARQNLRLPFADAGAVAAGRFNRQVQFRETLALLPVVAVDIDMHAERFMGSIVRQALGMVADGFRLQCLLEAPSAEAYTRRLRYEGRATSVNIPGLVYSAFHAAADLPNGETVEHFFAYGRQMSNLILDKNIDAYGGAVYENVGLTHHAPTVLAAHEVQSAGIRLAAGSVIMLAHLNDGNYGAVPFITPQPEAIASTYYPLAA
jgi:hypothetical protein